MHNVIEEMNGETLSYNDFKRIIEDQIQEQGKYEEQKNKEKMLIAEIHQISQTHKKLMNEFSKEQEE